MFHMGWFFGHGYALQSWNPAVDGPWTGSNVSDWMKPDLYIDTATSVERAGFDFLMIEDTYQVPDDFGGTPEATLRLGIFSPKNDPMPLMPLLARATKHIGVIPTVSTSFFPPYLAARLLTTLDHLTEGRVGYNVVTSNADRSAQNYGLDALPPKNLRYEIANEWVDVVKGLMNTWEPGAVVADVERGIYADHTKVHALNHVGKHFKVRGPLNTIPGPQRQIPMVEAGNSPPGRDLAARHADVLLALCAQVDQMKALRDDMHRRLRGYGRDPSQFKVLFTFAPVLGATDAEARERQRAYESLRRTDDMIETCLWQLSTHSGVDFSKFDVDQTGDKVLAGLRSRSGQSLSVLEDIFKGREHRTLRDILAAHSMVPDLDMVGSPATVASKMAEIMQEVSGDGFLIHAGPFQGQAQRVYVAEICDGLCSVLQQRGLLRRGYEGNTFRDNLLAF